METAIISAIIAASISFIGLLVQIYIAKKNRESDQIKLLIQKQLQIENSKSEKIQILLSDTEKLRNRCYILSGSLDTLQGIPIKLELSKGLEYITKA
jgi:hypothetical protein